MLTATSWVEVGRRELVLDSSRGVWLAYFRNLLYLNCVLLRNAIYRWNAGIQAEFTYAFIDYVNRV